MDKKQARVGFGVMILRDGKVLLGQRHVDPEKASSGLKGEGTWTMPGGKLDFGETVVAGAAREVKEETSIEVDPSSLKLISLTDNIIPNVHFLTVGFLAEDFSGTAKVMEPDEITEWKWFRLNELPQNLYPASKQVIENYLSGNIYSIEG